MIWEHTKGIVVPWAFVPVIMITVMAFSSWIAGWFSELSWRAIDRFVAVPRVKVFWKRYQEFWKYLEDLGEREIF
jgi:hypothetical protein